MFLRLFLFVQVINGKEGDNDGSLVGVIVVFFVLAVASHLTLFKALCAIEHNVNDAYVCQNRGDPLTNSCISGDACDEHAGPEDDLAKVIGATAELGIRGVYPIITDNCALNKSVLEKKREKWQKVMYEASKQCERAKVPTCFEITTLEKVLDLDFDKILILAERSTEISLKEFLSKNKIKKGEKVLAIIGPEGGFSQSEFDYFRDKKLPLISLGDLILKAETAVIMTLGSIVYEYQG